MNNAKYAIKEIVKTSTSTSVHLEISLFVHASTTCLYNVTPCLNCGKMYSIPLNPFMLYVASWTYKRTKPAHPNMTKDMPIQRRMDDGQKLAHKGECTYYTDSTNKNIKAHTRSDLASQKAKYLKESYSLIFGR